ncbi:MAG: DivIVA domain-containing protein [Actinomycetota bacterium]
MEITAQEINEKKFHDAWRGYNQDEVDDFLDRIALAIGALERENQSLHDRILELDQKVEAGRGSEDMLRKTLAGAQNAAQEAIAAAKQRAEQIVADAEERAARARDELRMRVETAETEVRRRTEEIEREQEERRRAIQESVDRLEAFETDLKRKLRAFFEQQATGLEVLQERSEPESPMEIVVDEPAAGEFDAAEESAPPAEEFVAPNGEVVEIEEEPDLEDFGPFDDEEEAFGEGGRRRKRGLFRRDRDVEVQTEEG